MGKDWPNEMIAKLIDMYRERPSLWKHSHPGYMNKKIKTKDYQQITEEMRKTLPSVDVSLVKAKIQNLRSCFRKELNKVIVSEQSGGDIHEPSLWYYERLSFVKDQDGPLHNLHLDHPVNSERSPQGSSQSQMSFENDDSETEETNYEALNELHPEVEIHQSFKEPQLPPAKRSRLARPSEPAMSALLKTLTSVLTAQPENDEYATTGKYIAQKLKQMTPKQQILAESIIQQVLSKGLRSQLTEATALVDCAGYDS